jgi:hypothetical protein
MEFRKTKKGTPLKSNKDVMFKISANLVENCRSYFVAKMALKRVFCNFEMAPLRQICDLAKNILHN